MTSDDEPALLEPVDLGDRWELPVARRVGERVGEVDQLILDFAFTVAISGVLDIRIGTEFSLTSAGTEVVFEPEDTLSLAPLLGLNRAGVLAASVSKSGTVLVEFEDGRLLRVEPDDRFEACTVNVRAARRPRFPVRRPARWWAGRVHQPRGRAVTASSSGT